VSGDESGIYISAIGGTKEKAGRKEERKKEKLE